MIANGDFRFFFADDRPLSISHLIYIKRAVFFFLKRFKVLLFVANPW
jgi:hypothetical protein